MGSLPNLIGYLEHHDEDTDGSFSICIAGGTGIFVSKTLWESIPEAHRPSLDTTLKPTVEFSVIGGQEEAIGSTIMPIVFTNADTGVKFRVKVYALVLPNLALGMFIGSRSSFVKSSRHEMRGVRHIFDFGNGMQVPVEYAF